MFHRNMYTVNMEGSNEIKIRFSRIDIEKEEDPTGAKSQIDLQEVNNHTEKHIETRDLI